MSATLPAAPDSLWTRLTAVFTDIKLAHTIFALPFALLAAHLAFERAGGYRWDTLLAILGCMVTARSAAMGFNRWLDREIDRKNPRTQGRAIPAGQVPPQFMLAFTVASSALFIGITAFINPLALGLSPVALAIILGYSAAKRFTSLAHLWLGFSLAIAPMGAWIAVAGAFAPEPFWLVLAVMTWVGGFDILYSCQDTAFDQAEGLHSIPRRYGIPWALAISSGLHMVTVFALLVFGWHYGLGNLYQGTVLVIAAILVWEHRMVKPDDLSRINAAFFTLNGLISVLLYVGVLADRWVAG